MEAIKRNVNTAAPCRRCDVMKKIMSLPTSGSECTHYDIGVIIENFVKEIGIVLKNKWKDLCYLCYQSSQFFQLLELLHVSIFMLFSVLIKYMSDV